MPEQMGDPGARRAVGRANGTNMICTSFPVIHADALGLRWQALAQEVAPRARLEVPLGQKDSRAGEPTGEQIIQGII